MRRSSISAPRCSPAAQPGCSARRFRPWSTSFNRASGTPKSWTCAASDIELAKAEAEGAAAHAAIEAQATRERAEWEALEASYREAGRRWSRRGDGLLMQLVDAVRGLTRPALTWSLFALVGAIYFLLGATDLAAVSLRPRIVETVLYLFTAAVLWWFGARQIEKRRVRPGGAGR